MTAQELIASAYRLVGVLAAGQIMSGDRAAIGLEALNQLIDQFNVEGTTLYTVTTAVLPLTPSVASYTLGPTGSLVVASRPPALISAMIRDNAGSPGPTDRPLTILEAADYNLIATKGLLSSDPQFLYYEPSFPNGTLTLYPVPNTARSLVLQFAGALNSSLTLFSDISLPPAYMRALRFNLAVALSVEAGRQQVNPNILQIAYESKTLLERANTRVPTLNYNLGQAHYDINTDTWR